MVEDILELRKSDLSTTPLRSVKKNIYDDTEKPKDIIKINNGFLKRNRLRRLSLLVSGATASVINNSKVVKKYKITLPVPGEIFKDVIKCIDEDCLTNHAPLQVKTEFEVIKYKHLPDKLYLRCAHCDREILLDVDEIEFIKIPKSFVRSTLT